MSAAAYTTTPRVFAMHGERVREWMAKQSTIASSSVHSLISSESGSQSVSSRGNTGTHVSPVHEERGHSKDLGIGFLIPFTSQSNPDLHHSTAATINETSQRKPKKVTFCPETTAIIKDHAQSPASRSSIRRKSFNEL
eukprot:62206-Hanusia_phi.AAC.1